MATKTDKEKIFGLDWSDGDQLDLTHVYDSMDKYAKQECIAFLIYAFGDAYNTKLFSEYAEYLYKQYLKSKNAEPERF